MRLSVAALAMLVAVAGALPPPDAAYNILMPIVFSSRSHLNVFGAIAKALAQRGHKVSSLPFLSCCHRTKTTRSRPQPLPSVDTRLALPPLQFLSCCHRTTTRLVSSLVSLPYKLIFSSNNNNKVSPVERIGFKILFGNE